eukprot:m51a1_g12135 hypothetical protein (281) ;mRNA; r:985-2925
MAMAEPPTSPRLLLSFTSLNGHNRRLQRLELVVPESWRLARHMSSDQIVIAVVHATACCCPDRDAALEAAGVVKCPLCARVILVQLNASSDLQDSHTVALPDGSRIERFSFAIRSQCIHQVIDAAWVRVQLGDCAVLSASSFSLNSGRTRTSQVANTPTPLVLCCTDDIRNSVAGCVSIVVRCMPGPRIVTVAIWENQQAMSNGEEMYLRYKEADGVAGCVSIVVRCMPGPRIVTVAIWGSQQAMSHADEIYACYKEADGHLHPAMHPRLRLISDVVCHK